MDNLTPCLQPNLWATTVVNFMIIFFPSRNSAVYNPLFPVNNTLLICHFVFIALSITANLPSFISGIFDQIPLKNYTNKFRLLAQSSHYCRFLRVLKTEIILSDCWDTDLDISLFSTVVWYRSQDYKIFSSKLIYTTGLRVHDWRRSAYS